VRVCVDPVQKEGASRVLLRGGTFSNLAPYLCAAGRFSNWSSYRSHFYGFRICITPEDSMQVARDPVQQDGSDRVLRGGTFDSRAPHARSSFRSGNRLSNRNVSFNGLRLSLTPSEPHLVTTSTDDTLSAITLGSLESPADPLVWLALADYLEESGEDDRSTLVRATLAMRQALPGTPDHTCHQQIVQTLIARGVRPCHPTIELDALPGARFAVIPPGGFLMGTQGRPVVISQPFFLGTTPITQTQWQHVMGRNPARFHDHPGSPNYPVEMVSWNDCQEFCRKLQAALPGWKVSLPTDAQWEYACRAGTQTPYYHGDDEASLARYAHYNAQSPRAVGELLPNAFGLHDMLGNVWEWCQDGYRSDPLEGQETVEVSEEEWKWLRGGGWWTAGHTVTQDARKSSGDFRESSGRGMRLALDPQGHNRRSDQNIHRGGSWAYTTAELGVAEAAQVPTNTIGAFRTDGLRITLDPDGGETDWQTVRGGAYTNAALPSRIPCRGYGLAPSIGLRVTLDPAGPALDPGKHAWGNIRGGAWFHTAGDLKRRLYSAHTTQTPITSLGLRVCVDPVQQDGRYRVLRGGSCGTAAAYCQPDSRAMNTQENQYNFWGFRLVLEGASA